MSTFVLVHGAWHGRWAWEKIIPLLEESGHKVEAPDLPGHGHDDTPVSQVSLQDYTDRVCEALVEQPEPAILVGHSMGGVVISQAAEKCPLNIQTLVYLSAFLLPNDTSLVQVAQQDTESVVTQNLRVDEETGIASLPSEKLKEAFYGDCPEEDATWAESLIQTQPWDPFVTPVNITQENFGHVPRVYVSCLRDRAITQSAQESMYTALSCQKLVRMNTDHSPFLSAPEELAKHLASLTAADW